MPMNRKLYPPNWEEITAKLKEEVGQRCEQCGLQNHRYIYRNKFDPTRYIYATPPFGSLVNDEDVEEFYRHRTEYPRNPHQVVLTTAHLDHNPANNDPDNLRVLCQRCHLIYDSPHHQANARKTRISKKAQAKLKAGQLLIFREDI